MNNTRARSMSSAFANIPRPHVIRRSLSASFGLTPRCLRVVVLGVGGVGKTAMTVRFVTNRFIGDYDPTLETIYRHTTVVDEEMVNFEIMDTAGQEENSLLLEDKCKWGESFIFVYDVTDKYSFDELSRLKFIASYTHSKLRLSFTPCWILVGNKADLADRDRMVTTEEGSTLARDLGCQQFYEISVKESIDDSTAVFENLWREFSRHSSRLPSSSQRRKFSCRIQDKIPILNSSASACASEAIKNIAMHSNCNGGNVFNLANTFKRQTSSSTLSAPFTRVAKECACNDPNNNEERFDCARNISCIPEDLDEDEANQTIVPDYARSRSRRKAIVINPLLEDNKMMPLSMFSQRKAQSVDNVYASVNWTPASVSLTASSTSSSNTSLNGTGSLNQYSNGITAKGNDCRNRSNSDASSLVWKKNSCKDAGDLVHLYKEHCRRNRGRRCETTRGLCNNFAPATFDSTYKFEDL